MLSWSVDNKILIGSDDRSVNYKDDNRLLYIEISMINGVKI